tara:strand:- start:36 stop:1118 length:1083 start_codon:yes stop_codon:yes gene_type:complete
MEIYPAYLLLFIILLVILRLLKSITNENKYHLRYLVYHFIFQAISVINISLYLSFDLRIPLLIVTTARVFVYIFFFLFLKSIFKNEKAKLQFINIIPILILILTYSLNASGITLFNFVDTMISQENIMGFNSIDFIGMSDFFVVFCITILLFTCLIFNKSFQILKCEFISDKNKIKVSDLLKYYLLIFIILAFSTLLVLGLFLLNIKLPVILILIKLLGILIVMVLIIKPQILKGIIHIKNSDELDQSLKILYHKIECLFTENNNFLNPKYTSASITTETGIRSELVRKSIKLYSDMSVPMYINSYRINHAVKSINDGYLKNYSMEALAESAGFKSQENFNRVFKLLKQFTPSEYLNSKK